MRQQLERFGNLLGALVLGLGLYLVARDHPLATGAVIGGTAIGILALTAWYDFTYWKRKWVLWRHKTVLVAAEAAIAPHLDGLARRMGEVVKWDGRWDYDMEPWVPILRDAVDVSIVPTLPADVQAVIAANEPYLRDAIANRVTGEAFTEAQRLGLIT